MTCQACTEAKIAPGGLYHSGCHGCWVRSLARSPKAVRQTAYDKEIDLVKRKVLVEEVFAEYQRLRALELRDNDSAHTKG